MNERLLQFIWQMQYFNASDLLTADGESLLILRKGERNFNQGPDFTDAKIRIESTVWAGNIELHVRSSDWNLHQHSNDKNYNNTILHVVWENNEIIRDSSGNPIPTLELQDRVSKILTNHYEELMRSKTSIACEGSIGSVSDLILMGWKDRLLAERMNRKSQIIIQGLGECNNHWEEIFWWTIARNFGIHLNSDSFEAIARSIPLKVLSKHKNQLLQLESLLLGQAALLEVPFQDKYPLMLKKEYDFLSRKYGLTKPEAPIHFLRTRPGNFPSVRLAQLAMLIHQSKHLFAQIKELDSIKEVRELLDVTANDYWHYHYILDEPSVFMKKNLGKQMIENIIINTIVPILFAYGTVKREMIYKEKANKWLASLSAENNSILEYWESIGIPSVNAFDSQALLELKIYYCNNRRCLDCAIGNSILNRN